MQNPGRHTYNLYQHPLQPIEPLPNWSWNNRAVASNKGHMEIGGLLSSNARHSVGAEAQMRRQVHHSLSTGTHFEVGFPGSISSNHNGYHLGHSTTMDFPQLHQPQSLQLMPNNISPISSDSTSNVETRSPKIKAEPAVKSFTCSNLECGKAFARRSDLARHGACETR